MGCFCLFISSRGSSGLGRRGTSSRLGVSSGLGANSSGNLVFKGVDLGDARVKVSGLLGGLELDSRGEGGGKCGSSEE